MFGVRFHTPKIVQEAARGSYDPLQEASRGSESAFSHRKACRRLAELLRGLKAWFRFSRARTEIACARRLWFCGLCNNHMT